MHNSQPDEANQRVSPRMGPDTLAFVACCLCNFVDMMGISMCGPVLVPYGKTKLGATLGQIGVFQTVSRWPGRRDHE